MSFAYLTSTDIWVVVCYLILTLFIGLYKARVKIDSVEDFYLASRQFSLPVMVATISATTIGGGSTLGHVEQVYKFGIIVVISCLASPINKLITAYIVGPRVLRFRRALSVGDLMGQAYGANAKMITGISASLWAAGVLGAQVSAMGSLLHFTLGLPFAQGAIISSIVIIIYSAFGGIRAVTMTDAFQFAILIITIPMVCNLGLVKFGGYLNLFDAVPAKYYSAALSPRSLNGYLFLIVAFSVPYLIPDIFQRILMCPNADHCKKAFTIAALVDLPILFMVTVIGLIAIVLMPGQESNLIFLKLVNSFLPDGMRGFVIAGILAVIMSTADSILNATSITFTHDVIKPLCKKITDKQEIWVAKVVTIIIGIFAIFTAIFFQEIREIIIASQVFWRPIIVAPLYAIIFNIPAPKRSFYLGVGAGIATMLGWYYLDIYRHTGVDSLFPSMVANGLAFYLSRLGYSATNIIPDKYLVDEEEDPHLAQEASYTHFANYRMRKVEREV